MTVAIYKRTGDGYSPDDYKPTAVYDRGLWVVTLDDDWMTYYPNGTPESVILRQLDGPDTVARELDGAKAMTDTIVDHLRQQDTDIDKVASDAVPTQFDTVGGQDEEASEVSDEVERDPEDPEQNGLKPTWKSDDDPCWDGYEQVGMKEQDGEMVPDCVPKDDTEKADPWMPYQGPRGGEGWQHAGTGEVVYQDDKPTGGSDEQVGSPDAEPFTEPPGGYSEGWVQPPDDPDDVVMGHHVEFYRDGSYYEGQMVGRGRDEQVLLNIDGQAVRVSTDEMTAVQDPVPEDPAQFVDEFDPDDYEYGEWQDLNQDDIKPGVVVSGVNNHTFQDDTALVIGQEQDGGYRVINGEGKHMSVPEEFNILEQFDTGEWRQDFDNPPAEPEGSDEEADEGFPTEWYDEIEQTEFTYDEIAEDGGVIVDGDLYPHGEETSAFSPDRIGWDYRIIEGNIMREASKGHMDSSHTNYAMFPGDSEYEDGFYHPHGEMEVEDGTYVQDFIRPDGSVETVPSGAPDEVFVDTANAERLDVEHGNPWEKDKYDGKYDPDTEQFPDHLDVARGLGLENDEEKYAMRGLQKADDLGMLDRTDKIEVNSMLALGRYKPKDREIAISRVQFKEDKFNDMDEEFFVGDNMADVLIHEAMHSLHSEKLTEQMSEDELLDWVQRDIPTGEREILDSDVSEYSTKNPLEVVAEIGTKIILGEPVSDRAMYLYQKYEGPEL